jgi:hypothetical protein
MKLKMCYSNSLGCEWLIEEVEIEDVESALLTLKDYIKRNKNDAENLTRGWIRGGEDSSTAQLWVDAMTTDREIYHQLENYIILSEDT